MSRSRSSISFLIRSGSLTSRAITYFNPAFEQWWESLTGAPPRRGITVDAASSLHDAQQPRARGAWPGEGYGSLTLEEVFADHGAAGGAGVARGR